LLAVVFFSCHVDKKTNANKWKSQELVLEEPT
jgi:hypothetical protein